MNGFIGFLGAIFIEEPFLAVIMSSKFWQTHVRRELMDRLHIDRPMVFQA
jgi:hypothetical protein